MTFFIAILLIILVLAFLGYCNEKNGEFICIVNRYSQIGRIELKMPDGTLRWIQFKEGDKLPPVDEVVVVKIYFNRYKGYQMLDANKKMFFD